MILGWPKRRDIYDRDEQAVYLTRWFLLGTHSSWLALMLHKMHQPDDDACHHDHPWSFLTLVLWGGYFEEMTAADGSVRTLHNRPGRIRYRRAEHTHRVHRLPRGSCYTLVLRFRWRREWGFHTPEGWVQWKRFIDLRGAVAWCDGWDRRRRS